MLANPVWMNTKSCISRPDIVTDGLLGISPDVLSCERMERLCKSKEKMATDTCSSMAACFMQARDYLGAEDPTQEPLQYVLESTAAAGSCPHGLPYLPTGNLVSGLPAALMSCCQVGPTTQSSQPSCSISSGNVECLWRWACV